MQYFIRLIFVSHQQRKFSNIKFFPNYSITCTRVHIKGSIKYARIIKSIHRRQAYYASLAQVILVSNQYSLIEHSVCINHIPKPEDMHYAIPRGQIPCTNMIFLPLTYLYS